MEIIVGSQWATQKKLLESPFFKELALFFYEATAAPTLREIKTAFPAAKIEPILDKLIDIQLIKRQNRRYYLQLPFYEQAWNTAETPTIYKALLAQVLPLSHLEKYQWFERYVSAIAQTQECYAYATGLPLMISRQVATPNFIVKDWTLSQTYQTIPGYFAALRQAGDILDAEFAPFQYLGDVDSVYYLDQLSVIFEKVVAQRHRIRPSIFTKSLVDFGLDVTNLAMNPYEISDVATFDILPVFTEMTAFQQRSILAAVWQAAELVETQQVFLKTKEEWWQFSVKSDR